MAVLYTDDFESYTLGLDPTPNWTTKTQDGAPPNMPVVTNAQIGGTQKLRNQAGLWNWQRYDGITIADSIIQGRFGTIGPTGDIRFILRNNTFIVPPTNFPSEGYMFSLNVLGDITIARLDGGAGTTLATTTFPGGSSMSDFIMRGEAEGTALRLYIDGILELSTTDAIYASGKTTIGGLFTNGGFNFDDFSISDFAVTAANLLDRRRRR